MTDPATAPDDVDPGTPNVARMYDYWLGGKDNFAADRQAAQQILSLMPQAATWVRENRQFLARTVGHLVAAGIRQFIDIGTGLPTQDNVHQIAQRSDRRCRVVYVDNDPVVVTHGRALLANHSDTTTVIQADMRRPQEILDHPETQALINLAEPVAVLLVAVLHFIPDDQEAAQIVTRLRHPLRKGSHLVISHATPGDIDPVTVRKGQDVYDTTSARSITPRRPEQIAAFFDGLKLVKPGLVHVTQWGIQDPPGVDTSRPGFLGGIGRKPI